MARPTADHLSPIEVHFGDVFEVAETNKRAVVVELGIENYIQAAKITKETEGLEVLGGIGTMHRYDISKVIGRWELSRVQNALLRNNVFSRSTQATQQDLVNTLLKESQKPPTLLT